MMFFHRLKICVLASFSISMSALIANYFFPEHINDSPVRSCLVFIAEPELWCPSTPRNTSPLNRRFPTGGKLVMIEIFLGYEIGHIV